MCGIVGIFDTSTSRPVDPAVLQRMNDQHFHRGPDEGGIHTEPGLGLGHRRLSIIDLSSGRQPLFNEDGTVAVVYNGEIYNFQSLMQELKSKGHTFKTRCDTEVIVHAWEEWAERCVERFRGMFAFAIWDRNRQSLFLARDRIGIKPLYYSMMPGGQFCFASELKGLLVHPSLPRELCPPAIEEYFAYGYVPEPRTILSHAFKLPPGHFLLIGRDVPKPRITRYWDVAFAEEGANGEDQTCDALIEQLRDAVDMRLIADVPLGAFLSGGVDSSAVVAMMAGLRGEPVNTCSISFGDREFNEAQYAEQVARRYGTRHCVEQVDPEDFDLIDNLAAIYDEPFADSSAIPTYRVCQLARKHVTVALSGDGGDENFAGYRRYRWHLYEERIRSLLPAAVRRPVFGVMGRCYPKADWAPKVLRAKATFEALARNAAEGYFHSVSVLGDGLRAGLFNDDFRRQLQGYQAVEVLRAHMADAPQHPLSRVQYLDLKTYLVGDILTKVDRASMAHSLEVRVPILDHHLVEWTARMPPRYKLHGREGKYILKRALERYLPHEVLYRPKMGFSVPLARWCRGPLRQRVRDAILGPTLEQTGLFSEPFLRSLVEHHQSGRRDNSAALWSLLMFEAAYRRLMA